MVQNYWAGTAIARPELFGQQNSQAKTAGPKHPCQNSWAETAGLEPLWWNHRAWNSQARTAGPQQLERNLRTHLKSVKMNSIYPSCVCTLICNSNRTRDFRSSFFVTFLQFSQQPIKIQKPTIRHLKGLIVDIINLEGQDHSTIRDWPESLNVKKQTFQEKWAWQAIEAATPLSF